MLFSHHYQYAIIQTPRSGASSLAEGLKAVDCSCFPPHAKETMEFPNYKRIIVLRPPYDRFLSCTKWMLEHEWVWEKGVEKFHEMGFEKWVTWVSFRRWSDLPELFQPQTDWIDESHMIEALFLARSNMADFFNVNQYGCLIHRNQSTKHPKVPMLRHLEQPQKDSITKLYLQDFQFMNSQSVWPSKGRDQRIMKSGCRTCGKRG